MLLQIPDVLTAEQVAHARHLLDTANWVDGRVTAGRQSAQVKDNIQLPIEAVSRSGTHVDNAIRQISGTHLRIRTDLSATLFLGDPEEYDGGELVVEDTYGVHSVKRPSGHMVLYPSTSLHHVRPVTRGARVASFFWTQSMLRDDGDRTLLFDLDTAIQRLTVDMADHPGAVQLTAVYHNLLRRWADL